MDKFKFIYDKVTDISNLIYGDLKTKTEIQESLLKLIIISCKLYENNNDFKNKFNEMDRYFMSKI